MAVRIGSVQAVISCLAVGACVQGIPPVDNEGDTDTTGAPMEPPNPDVVFDGLGPGLVLNPDHVAPGAVVIVGAPGRSVESAAGSGRVFLMESVTGGGLGTAVSVAPTLAEGDSVAAPDCSRSLEIDSGPNRKFGSSLALYSRAVVPDVNVLEYTQNLLVGAPTAGAMSGRVIGTAGCASCGLLPRPPGELLETEVGTRFGTSLSVGFFEGDVAGGVEFLAVGAPSFNFVGGVHIYSQQGFRTWETETGFPIGDGLLACDFGGNVGPNPDSETFRERTLSGGFANEGFGSALVTGARLVTQGEFMVIGAEGDRFGAALATPRAFARPPFTSL